MKYAALIAPVVLLLLPGACGPGDASTDGSTDTTGMSGGLTETTDPSESGGATEVTGSTAPTGEPDELPAACGESDPAVSASFEVLVDGQPGYYSLVLPCVVDVVVTDGSTSDTLLTCDDNGSPVAVTVRLPVSPEGAVAWGTGDAVTLDAKRENFDVYENSHLELRGADATLLAAGYLPNIGALVPGRFAPITVEAVAACGAIKGFMESDVTSYRLDFQLEGMPPVSVFSGHRGVLVIDADERFAIDVQRARYNDCCHADESFELLVRRVKPG